MFTVSKKPLCGAIALAASMSAGTVLAAGLEEVVVTAQKREQSVQDVPVAISAFDADAIEKQGISDVADIGAFVPNVQIAETPSNSTGATIGIRGSVTINPALTWEPTVGLYLDGVFIGKNIGGIFDVAELERVEVLRGPQGTLYGKNTIGGAVNLITRKPSGEFSGKVKLGMGNYDYQSTFVSIDTPKMGALSANVALLDESRDGFYTNYGTSSDEFKSLDNRAGRVSLLLEPTDALEIQYAYDFSRKDQQPGMGQLTYADPSIVPGLVPYVTDEDKRSDGSMNDKSMFEKSDSHGHALHVTYDINDTMTFKSITSQRELEWSDHIDIDGTPTDYFNSARDINYEQFSQEFQLIGSTDSVDYVLGIYHFSEDATVANPIAFFNFDGWGAPISNNSYGFDNTTLAVFGQADWRATDRLTLTLGLRWNKEEKDIWVNHPAPRASTPVYYASAEDEWINTSPSFVASYAISDEINVYGKVAKGWKSGGFNAEADAPADFYQGYDPEDVLSLEFGVKSRILDNRVQLNAAVFENTNKDMQFSVFSGGASASSNVANAGEAVTRGAELEVIAQPTADLTASVNFGYLDTEYKEYIDGGVDVKDDRSFPYSPRKTASVSLDYTVGEFDFGTLNARLDWSYKGAYVPYTDPAQNATSQIDSYDLLNARLTLSDVKLGDAGSLKVSAWVKNLTDEEYRVNTIPFIIWTTSYFGNPRTYGLDVSYEF